MQVQEVVLLPTDSELPNFLDSRDPDRANDDAGYMVNSLIDGQFYGLVGVTVPEEDGLGAVYGWVSPHTGARSTEPFKTLETALRDLLSNSDL